jgi:hypothetical protein
LRRGPVELPVIVPDPQDPWIGPAVNARSASKMTLDFFAISTAYCSIGASDGVRFGRYFGGLHQVKPPL